MNYEIEIKRTEEQLAELLRRKTKLASCPFYEQTVRGLRQQILNEQYHNEDNFSAADSQYNVVRYWSQK